MGNGVVLKEKALYAEGDAGNPKKVNIVLGDTPAMIFEFETKELADKMIDWVGGSNNNSDEELKASTKLVAFLIKEETPVKHVYNDYKGANSYYCEEHKDHPSFSGAKCMDDGHYGEISKLGIKGIGNPTIGIGHLIVGEAELKQWCEKEPLSQQDVEDLLLNVDLPPREAQLKVSLPKSPQPTQCQYDALLSIVFNRGIGKEECSKGEGKCGFKSSAVYKQYLKKGNFNGLDEVERIDLEDKLINDGSLLSGSSRRKAEANLYFNCKY